MKALNTVFAMFKTWIAPHLLVKFGDVGKYVLLPGDPGRAHRIAGFLKDAKLISHNREFVVYTGYYGEAKVSVVSTGIGGPSTAIALEELIRVGGEVFIRVGTCGALQKGIKIGAIVIPYAAVRLNGVTKRYIEPEYPAVAHPLIYHSLVEASRNLKVQAITGIIVSEDAFYIEQSKLLYWSRKNIIAVEMEASTVFTIASLKNKMAGAILAVDGNIVEGTGKAVLGALGRKEYSEDVMKAIDLETKIALEAIRILESRKTVQ